MSTVWGRVRKEAKRAGEYAAHGGDDRRAEFVTKHEGETYDDAYADEMRKIEADEMTRKFNQPLMAIRDSAACVACSEDRDVSSLAAMMVKLVDYLMDENI